MVDRESAEIPGMDWKKAFAEMYSGRDGFSASWMLQILDARDSFVPEAIGALRDSDLPALLSLSSLVHRLGMQNSYNFFFAHLINKAIILVLGNFPEKFEKLSASEKEKVLGIKLELPDEDAVFYQVYQYTQKRIKLPHATLDNGATMESVLARANEMAAGEDEVEVMVVDGRVVEALCAMDEQYGRFFGERRKM